MSPALAARILDHAFTQDKPLYRATLTSVAEAKKVRPLFLERKPRVERDKDITGMLAKPRLDMAAATLLRGWLMKEQKAMIILFLDSLGISHKDGAVDDLPPAMDQAKLQGAVDKLLAQFPPEEVAVYLNAFYSMNEVTWDNLKKMLEDDPRLQFHG